MKRIVNGRLYDTDTAEKIFRYEELSRNRMPPRPNLLYRKKNGEFFIRVQESVWADDEMDSIMPLTDAEARRWCESRMCIDDYECCFGKVTEDGVPISEAAGNSTPDISSEALLRYCDSCAENMQKMMNSCLAEGGHGASPDGSISAYAYFSQRYSLFKYEIPGIIQDILAERGNIK